MIKIKIFLIGIFTCLISCNTSKKDLIVKINEQQIVYDSVASYGKKFNIQLLTRLQFNVSNIERKQYNDFQIIIDKDTLALVPKVNFLNKRLSKGWEIIEYTTNTKIYSKNFRNDSITNLIKNSKIIDSESNVLKRSEDFDVQSVETFVISKEVYEQIKKERNIK